MYRFVWVVIILALVSLRTGAYASVPQTKSQEVTAQVTVPYTASVPAIDGTADALWQSVPPQFVANPLGVILSLSDLSASYRALYDNDRLYVLVTVTDDTLVLDSPAQRWDDDVVEFYFDGDYSHNATYQAQDFQLVVPYTANQIQLGVSTASMPAGVVVSSTTSSGRYTMELSIPWTSLGVTAADGHKIGFEIHVGDDDDGGARDAHIMWNGTQDLAYYRTDAFGDAILGNAPATPTPTLTATATSTATPTKTPTVMPGPSATPTSVIAPGPFVRAYLPIGFRMHDNHTRCTAQVIVPPASVTQPPAKVFNMYLFSAMVPTYTVRIENYTYDGDLTGTLLLYVVESNACATGGGMTERLVANVTLAKNQRTDATFVGLSSGRQYLLVVYTRGGTKLTPYTISVSPAP